MRFLRRIIGKFDTNRITFKSKVCLVTLQADPFFLFEWTNEHLFVTNTGTPFLIQDSIYFYLFINYKTITNYILISYELSNFDHVLGVVSQTRVSGGNRTHDLHANSLAYYPLYYQGTIKIQLLSKDILPLILSSSREFSWMFSGQCRPLSK